MISSERSATLRLLLSPSTLIAFLIGRVREFFSEVRRQRDRTQRLEIMGQLMRKVVSQGILIQDSFGMVMECNAAAETIFGMSLEQMKRRPISDVPWQLIGENGNLLTNEENPFTYTIRTRRPLRNFTFGILTSDNETCWVSINTEPYLDSFGNVSSVVSSLADITQYREQSQRLQLIIDAAKIGTWDWDIPSGKVVFSEHWAQMLGYELKDLEPDVSTWEQILDPESFADAWSVVQQHITGKTEDYRNEFRLRRKDGSYAWVLAVGKIISRVADAAPKRMVGIHLDITEAKNHQTQIKMMTERYEAATSGTSDGLWDWDLKNDKCWYSDRFWTLLGYQEHGPFPEPKFKSIEEHIHPEDLPGARTAFRRHLDDGAEFDINLRLRTVCGEYRWFRGRGATQFDESRQPVRMAGSIQDVDDLKLAETSLIKANIRAEAANAAKSEFLANMSHEIRTPMTAILGYADLLLQEIACDANPKLSSEYVETIQRNGEHLLEIVNDILDLSKIDACKLSLTLVPTSLQDLVRDVESLMKLKALAKGILLTTHFSPEVPSCVIVDPLRLKQILVNLVGNAIKFTHSGSVKLKISNSSDEQFIQIDVEDTGIGMTPEQISRLFNAFEQGDISTTLKYGGTGLGLYISNRLAEMLNGKIKIESQVGRGSRFTLLIAARPVFESANTTSLTDRNRSSNALEVDQSKQNISLPLAGKRILLAEDGQDNQRLISHILQKAGADVQIAENGKRAIEMLTLDGTLDGELKSPCPFDLLLSDMQMPEMDGYASAQWLREHGSRIPIVALTAHAMNDDLQHCTESGCNAYATKPINKIELVNLCKKWACTELEASA